MLPSENNPPRIELDDFVRAFEVACGGGGSVDLNAFLPVTGHPLTAACRASSSALISSITGRKADPGAWSSIRVLFPSSSAIARACRRSPSRSIAFGAWRATV